MHLTAAPPWAPLRTLGHRSTRSWTGKRPITVAILVETEKPIANHGDPADHGTFEQHPQFLDESICGYRIRGLSALNELDGFSSRIASSSSPT